MGRRHQGTSKPGDLSSVSVARKREIDTGVSRLAEHVGMVGKKESGLLFAEASNRGFEVGFTRGEIVDARNPERISTASDSHSSIQKELDTRLIQNFSKSAKVAFRGVFVITRYGDNRILGLQRRETWAKRIQFGAIVIDEISRETDDVGRPGRNLSCEFLELGC